MIYDKCPICGDDIVFTLFNECKRCGKITFDKPAYDYLESKDGPRLRACLFYYLNNNKPKNGKPFLISCEEKPNRDDYNVIIVKEILKLYPKDFEEQVNMILLNLANINDTRFKEFSFNVGKINKIYDAAPIFFIESEGKDASVHISRLITSLYDKKYLKPTYEKYIDSFYIDSDGWSRIEEIKSKKRIYGQGFIAMWFNNDLMDIRRSIAEALKVTGYNHQILDEKEYNGLIVPEIFYEIDKSDFVIADLTGNRGGVYYEAGYALAKGKELIITVKDIGKDESEMDKEEKILYRPHFDVAQRNQIKYRDAMDLKTKLIKRITATVGNRNQE